ncbi:MAG: hypothetical protein WC761_04405 [Candidatus Paceibacterota bacterium]|jgi:hypothetical protein
MKRFSFLKAGTTRLTFLFGKYAFKIMRVRPLYGFRKANKARKEGLLGKKSFVRFLLGNALYGLVVNRLEYQYYQSHKNDEKVMPTEKMFLWGIAILQLRGSRGITDEELRTILVRNPINMLAQSDLTQAAQYCLHPHTGRIVVVDFGDPRTISVLPQLVV